MERGGDHVYDEISMNYSCQLIKRIVEPILFIFDYGLFNKKSYSIYRRNVVYCRMQCQANTTGDGGTVKHFLGISGKRLPKH